MISINNLYTIPGGKVFRVLWLSPEADTVFVIELTDCKLPVHTALSVLLEQIQDDEIQILSDDPYVPLVTENELSEKDTAFRDNAWALVMELVENEPAIYDRKSRGRMLGELSKSSGVTHRTLYKYLKWYWMRGKTKNALLPQHSNCGGKGKERRVSEKKRGRPRKYDDSVGKNVDEETRHVFEQAVKKYYHTRQEYNFKAAYELMVKEFYTSQVEQSDGSVRNELLDNNEIPTFGQFRYWYSKMYGTEDKLVARKGQKQYDLNHRAILGKSDLDIRGPGAQYQIDATVGDVYLVSQFNRASIIGRPVIYFIIDVFSRIVTGMHIGLEGPSWTGAMMALANAATDKVAYCGEYGILITDDEWPCRHIPDTILADRGEMESKSVEMLINALNVRVDNAPAYRADMKGIVEQFFNIINTKTTVYLPGHVKPDMAQRGGKDYRLDAKLDIHQFTKVIIQCVLNHNNGHFLESYERTEGMIADGIEPIPIKLWNWGIAHCSGLLRSVSADTIKLFLMPADKALVTAKGIRFKGLHYLSEQAVSEHWFERARAKGSYQVDISYDPRNMSNIYVRNIGGALFERCYLADWEAKWHGKSWDEVSQQQAEERALRNRDKNRELQARVDLNTEIEKVVKEAEQMAAQTALPSTKKGRISEIRQNRAEEKEALRRDEAFVLSDPEEQTQSQPPDIPEKPIHPITALIKKMAEESNDD